MKAKPSASLDYEQWVKQGGDTDGIMRTVCHQCDRMWPMDAMTENDRFDNVCPSCMPEQTTTLVLRSTDQQVARSITNAIIHGILLAACPLDCRKTLFKGRGMTINPLFVSLRPLDALPILWGGMS